MRKIAALLLCFLLLWSMSFGVFASDVEDEVTDTEISTKVPDTHKITVVTDGASVFYNGEASESYTVDRLSEPRLLIRADSGYVIKSVSVNGNDVTDALVGGFLTLEGIYEDKTVTVVTEKINELAGGKGYTLKGVITLNGAPFDNAKVELRSSLKETQTNDEGNFKFTGVGLGEHSLTVIKGGKVVGYVTFGLTKDNKTDVRLTDDGSYVISLEKNAAGVKLDLVLNEENGVIEPTEVETIEKNLWWLWIILILCVILIITLFTVYFKKKT